MADSSDKRWYALIAVDSVEAHGDPPLGEVLAEPVEAMLLAAPASKSWTTWTTGYPPDTKGDAGYELDP